MKNSDSPAILVVDDSSSIRATVQKDLESEGFRVFTAVDGEEALSFLTRPGAPEIDMVLTDLNMPNMDGKKLCAHIKANPDLQSIPVIFLTSQADQKTESDLIKTGANDFITKPFIRELLIARISVHLQSQLSKKYLEKRIDEQTLFSKIEAGKMELEVIDIDLGKTLHDISQIMATKAQEKNIEYICLIEENVPNFLKGDPTRLRQIIINLSGNAVKFVEKGEILLRVSFVGKKKNRVTLRFEVIDTGIGIPDEQIQRLFKTFSQVDASTTRKYGGTGLGLTISRQLAELMGGKIGVVSKEGEGSTFWFTACFEKQAGLQEEPLQIPPKLKTLKCLVIDDMDSCRKAMILHLSSLGCRVESAQNATMALEKLMDAKLTGRPFDTIFIDMEMPDLDGKEFARRLLKGPHLKGAHLILMTYTGKRLDNTTLSSLGFTAQIAKPAYRTHVLECLMDIHNISPDPKQVETRFGIEEPQAAADPLPGRFHILLAEDNKMNQKVAVNMLQKLGHTITIAENGKEAVDRFMEKEFDLILMDGQMPVLDGLEATRAIREYEKKSSRSKNHILIIALTANAMKGDRERFLDSGMDDYITKPIKRKDLDDAIIRCMAKQNDLDVPMVKGDIIHLDELILSMNGDKKLVKECFDDFINHHVPMLNDIRSGIDKNDPPKVKASLLTFRDSVKHLSCKRIMDAAFSLDRAFENQNRALIEKEFNTLYNACNELKDFIIRYSVKNLFMKFLIVDDEFVSRKKAHKILSQYGECDVAINGLEALNAYVRAHNENDPYNLIFLDINMPDLNGPQVMTKIRQWEKTKGVALSEAVKIIMMSADGSKETIKAALK